jgi:DNA-binding beta-propeller fold protein YncE
VSPDGAAVFVTGMTLNRGPNGDEEDLAVTAAYGSSTGKRLWTAVFSGTAHGEAGGRSLAVSPDGKTVFVAADATGKGGTTAFTTLAYDAATGATRWIAWYEGTGYGHNGPSALAVSPDGSKVFVTGLSGGPDGEVDYATVAYDAVTGRQMWSARRGSPGRQNYPTALSLSQDGRLLVVTGDSKYSGRSYYMTVAYDAATGSRRWTSRYDSVGGGSSAVTVSPDGTRVYVTGQFENDFYATVAYDAKHGTQEWDARYQGARCCTSWASGLVVSPDGAAVYVSGSSLDQRGQQVATTVAYDAADGSQRWAASYGHPSEGNAIGISTDGTMVVVVGDTIRSQVRGARWNAQPPSSSLMVTVAYDSMTGDQLWARTVGGGMKYDQFATAWSVGFTPDGTKVFATGQVGDSHGVQVYTTVAYSAT